MVFQNLLKEKMRDGKVAFGTWITMDYHEVTPVLSHVDFDWLLFDMEHAPLTFQGLEVLLEGTSPSTTPIVRVAENSPALTKQALDIGAHGIMVPMVESGQDASRAVQGAKYPPQGIRGIGARRASAYYAELPQYLSVANEETMVVAQVESKRALAAFDSIIATKGIDVWFVGPNDLAASLGHIGKPGSEVVQEALSGLLRAGSRAGVPGGIYAGTARQAAKYARMGFRMLAAGTDTESMRGGASRSLAEFREGLREG